MVQDQQSYARAAKAALVGLVVQFVLAAGMLLVGLYAHSPALHAATWHLFGGLPIWGILLVIYHQHRIERAEALEAEQLSRADAQTAALFDEHGANLQLAQRRLTQLYKWGLGSVSIVTAVYLLLVGIWLFRSNSRLLAGLSTPGENVANAFGPEANALWVTVACLVFAMVAFLVARYVAGMTRVREWVLLRGGASYLMGTVLFSVLCAMGAFLIVYLFKGTRIIAVMGIAIPIVMGLIGSEMLVTQLLSMYRPRRADETPRPAFDSRVLGLLTSPESLAKTISDTINYQFGFEVSKSFFYRELSKRMAPMVATGIVVLMLISAVVVVAPHEQAIVTTFGAMRGQPLEPGVHFKWPWPIGRVERYPVQRVQEILLGSVAKDFKEDVAILWTNEHVEGRETYLITAPTPLDEAQRAVAAPDALDDAPPPEASAVDAAAAEQGKIPGVSLVGVQVVVQYQIKDLYQYVTSTEKPVETLSALASRRMSTYFFSRTIDELLGPLRAQAGDDLLEQIKADADAAGLGVEIIFVGLAGVHPPKDEQVAQTFLERINALQKQRTTIERARLQAVQMLTEVVGSQSMAQRIVEVMDELNSLDERIKAMEAAPAADAEALADLRAAKLVGERQVVELVLDAGGRASEVLNAARASRWRTVNREFARVQSFEAERVAYDAAPNYYVARQALETVAEGSRDVRKYVIASPMLGTPVFRLDLKETVSALSSVLETGN